MRTRIAVVTGALVSALAASPGALEARQSSPPAPLAERPIEFPGFEEFTLDNGLRVVILAYGTQPVASVRLYVPGGSAVEPSRLAGLAGITAGVLTKGTSSRSAVEISEAIEGVGGSLNASASQDFFTVSASSLTDHLELAFELMSDVVMDASFPQQEVELYQRQVLSSLQAQLGQPQAIAARRFASLLYGEAHPYGTQALPETVREIARDDLVQFRDRVLHANGALLMVAGRVDRARVEALAREYFGVLPSRAPVVPEFPAVSDPVEAQIHLVHRPGSVQSVVGVGNLGIRPDDPDYFPLLVLDRVLGGGADSRLFRILREEKGWTYGAYSSFNRPSDIGIVTVNTEVRTEVTDSTLTELIHQLHRLRDEPVPAEELEGAKNFLAGSFPLRLETADQVASQVATSLLRGLPIEDVTRYPERIRAVSAEDIQRVARTHIRPDRGIILVVGDGSHLVDQLEAIGPVTFLDIEGNPLTRAEVLGEGEEPSSFDVSLLSPHIRRYDVYVQGNPMGSAEYRLEREGDDWVSSVTTTVMGNGQQTTVRFSALDFTPISLEQEASQGPMSTSAQLRVSEDGRVTGTVSLPPQMGGDSELDHPFPAGTLLPGMDEYALSVSPLEEGARISLRVLDLGQGSVSVLDARVTGEETIELAGSSFDTWRVELTGGPIPMTLFLRKDAPHILVRQEFMGQPVRFDLTLLEER